MTVTVRQRRWLNLAGAGIVFGLEHDEACFLHVPLDLIAEEVGILDDENGYQITDPAGLGVFVQGTAPEHPAA